jgi:hypothetical protein
MIRIKVLLCIGILFLTLSAATDTDSMFGVWTGTVGKATINACFQKYGTGSYYYLKYRQPIQLRHSDDSGAWFEPDSCKWIIEKVAAGSATGTWSKPGKNVTHPIKLRLMGGDDEPCGCDLYNNPIEKMPKIKVDTVQEKGERCYRTLSVEEDEISMSWIELCGNNDAVVKLNQEFRKGFPADVNDAKTFYNCRRGTLSSFGSAACEDSRSISPYLWFGNYLEVVEFGGGFCGGAHPSYGSSYRIFDLTTGEEASLHSWIEQNDDLNRLILQKYDPDEADTDDNQCIEIIKDNDFYALRLDSTGIVFYTQFGHCCVACDKEFLLSFEELKPFLTEEGIKNVKFMLKMSKQKK